MAQNACTYLVHGGNSLYVHLALLRESLVEQPGLTIEDFNF